MPDLLVVALIVIVGLVAAWGGRRLVDMALDRRRPVEPPSPRRAIDMDRLLQIAAVTDEEIIKAAEWRAMHPDADEPSILRDLDPSAWTKKPSVPPPPPKLSNGGPTTARGTLAPGMVIVRADVEKFGERLLKEINGSRKTIVIPSSMEWKPLPTPYADCTHEDAEREDVMGFGSTEPIKSYVVACEHCDRRRRFTMLAEQIKEIEAGLPVAGDIPEDLLRHLQRLMAEAKGIRAQIRAADAEKAAEDTKQAARAAMRKDTTA